MAKGIPWRSAGLLAVLGGLAAEACHDETIALSVDLVTDLVPGTEFVEVTSELSPGTPAAREVKRRVAVSDKGFLQGLRVADFADLSSGSTSVVVSIASPGGKTVAERRARLTVSEDYALTLVISRDCQALVCPVPGGDPELSTCIGGTCASPDCLDGTSSACPKAECQTDKDCGAASSCAQPRCSKGVCLTLPDDTKCPAGQTCNPLSGCFAPTPACQPTSASETSCTDGKDDDCDGKVDCADPDCASKACDDGNLCTKDDVCQGGACVPGPVQGCSDDDPCTVDSCDPVKGCLHSAGPDGTACDDGNPCTDDDVCQAGVCQAGAAKNCDDQNPCTDDMCGADGECAHAANTASCDDGVFCNGSDSCAAGACSVHAGDTCAQACNEAKKACVACLSDKDCPTPADQVVEGCTYATCATTGTKTVKTFASTCNTTSGKCETTATTKKVATGCTRTVKSGQSCGTGKYCCSNACVARNDPDHCSSCGVACASGQSCKGIGSGHYTCTCNGTNAQCVTDGFGSDATCWNGLCQCQGQGSACKGGATCEVVSGNNYCTY